MSCLVCDCDNALSTEQILKTPSFFLPLLANSPCDDLAFYSMDSEGAFVYLSQSNRTSDKPRSERVAWPFVSRSANGIDQQRSDSQREMRSARRHAGKKLLFRNLRSGRKTASAQLLSRSNHLEWTSDWTNGSSPTLIGPISFHGRIFSSQVSLAITARATSHRSCIRGPA